MELTQENIEKVVQAMQMRTGKVTATMEKMQKQFDIAKDLIAQHPEINDPDLLGEIYEAQCAQREALEQNNNGQELSE